MRILGIDLGSRSIKAVEIETAFSRFDIQEYHEIKNEPGAGPGQALLKLFQSLSRPADRIAITLPTHQVTFRNLTIPTKEKKAIQSGIAFELEDELPFDSESVLSDYSILKQDRAGTELHVAATTKANLLHLLESLQPMGIDPDLVTTEAWSYRSLFNRILSPEVGERPSLLIQLGHERTLLYCHQHGKPIFIREISWGGRDLDLAICQKYQIPLEQAESAKLDHGFVVPQSQEDQVTPEQAEFSSAIRETLQNLIFEIKQSDLSCKGLTQEVISRFYIAGGTSLLPGLQRLLEEELRRPVVAAQAMTLASRASGVTYSEQADAAFITALSSALCLVGQDKSGMINLRKGAFAKAGSSREINLSSVRKPLMATAAILSCVMVSLIVQSQVYQAKSKELDSQLEKGIRSFFGQIASSAVRNYILDTGKLKTSINKEITKQKEITKLMGPNPNSPLDFLKEISTTIPKDIIVDMTQYQVGSSATSTYPSTTDRSASLTFLVANPQMAERLGSLLESKISGIQKSKPEEVPNPEPSPTAQNAKRWKITFSGKPSEESYGRK